MHTLGYSEADIELAKGRAQKLVELVTKLDSSYSGRQFAISNDMAESIGKVLASFYYGIDLYTISKAYCDGVVNGKKVSIITLRDESSSIVLSRASGNLIVLFLDINGRVYEVYNGLCSLPWKHAGKKNSHNQKHISISRIMELDRRVKTSSRIIHVQSIAKYSEFLSCTPVTVSSKLLTDIADLIRNNAASILANFNPVKASEDLHITEVCKKTKTGVIKKEIYESSLTARHSGNLDTMINYTLDVVDYTFISDLFGINYKNIIKDVVFNNPQGKMTLNDPDDTINCREQYFFDEYEFILDAVASKFIVESAGTSDEGIEHAIRLTITVSNLNHFSPKCDIDYTFRYHDLYTPNYIDHANKQLRFSVSGILKDDNIPLWMEYLIISWTLYKDENEKLAFFMAFAALDSVINAMCFAIKEIYKNAMKSYCVGSMEYDYLHDKADCFSNMRRNLMDEKFSDVMDELDVSKHSKYSALYAKLKEFTNIRDGIAHCFMKYEDGQYLELFRAIIDTLCLIKSDSIFSEIANYDERIKGE